MPDPSDWCYASGIVSVLETFLLPSNALRELAATASAGELLSRVRRSPVYSGMPAPDAGDPMRLAVALETALVGFVRSFAAECPDPRIADAFLVEYDLRDLSNHLKAEFCGAERRPVELSSLPEADVEAFIADAPRLRRAADQVAAACESAGTSLRPEVVDLIVDGATVAMLPELVAPLGSALIDTWAKRRRQFTAIEAALRARMQGVEESDIETHLLAAAPDAAAELRTPDAGRQTPAAVQQLAVRHDAELSRVLAPARFVAFGPERVFAFLWALWRENRNLRAVLAGQAGGAGPELGAQSLRGV